MLISWSMLAGPELTFGPGLETSCKQVCWQLLCQLSKVFVPFPTLAGGDMDSPQAKVSWQAKLWQWLGVGALSRGGQPGLVCWTWCSLV